MVNIQSIVRMTENEVQVFNSHQEYRSFSIESFKNNPASAAKAAQLRRLSAAYDESLAKSLKIDLKYTANITAVFGTLQETNKRIRDDAVKELLLNLDNKIVLEYRVTALTTYIIATIHTKEGYEQLSTTIKEARNCVLIREP